MVGWKRCISWLVLPRGRKRKERAYEARALAEYRYLPQADWRPIAARACCASSPVTIPMRPPAFTAQVDLLEPQLTFLASSREDMGVTQKACWYCFLPLSITTAIYELTRQTGAA
jgi:hypothetical protein